MTTEEKYYSAKMALKMIANTKPATHWEETHYNNGYNVPCEQCQKMKQIAEFALQELERPGKEVSNE